jgi:hypothetical protein
MIVPNNPPNIVPNIGPLAATVMAKGPVNSEKRINETDENDELISLGDKFEP